LGGSDIHSPLHTVDEKCMAQEVCCPASQSKTLVGQRRKQWQKHRVSTAPLKRQNSFVHVVGSHAQCAGISC
jgi:hypothetical protein